MYLRNFSKWRECLSERLRLNFRAEIPHEDVIVFRCKRGEKKMKIMER
jgi:hypothetical protein